MKILMIHNYYQQRGGEDAVFDAETALLRQYGHDVESLTFHNQSIRSFVSQIGAAVGSIFNIFSFFHAVRMILKFSPDIIHVHNFFPLASPSVLAAARLLRVPIVLTIHNYRLICANAVLYRENTGCQRCIHQDWAIEAIRFACYQNSRLRTAALVLMNGLHKILGTWHHWVTRYIALSQFEKDMLIHSSLSLDGTNIVIKPNFAFGSEAFYKPKEGQYFLFIGRLSIEKGIYPLVEAFKNTDLPLKIIGTGPFESLIQEVAVASPNIQYLGFQDKPAVYEYLQNAIALVFPSVLPETFGLSVVEAFSAHVPVITSRLGGPAEIVQDEVNGLHVEPASPKALQNAARRLYEDPILRKELSGQAFKAFQECYSPSANYQQLIGIYQDVIRNQHIA